MRTTAAKQRRRFQLAIARKKMLAKKNARKKIEKSRGIRRPAQEKCLSERQKCKSKCRLCNFTEKVDMKKCVTQPIETDDYLEETPKALQETTVALIPQHRACCGCVSRSAFEHVLSHAAAVTEYLLSGKGNKRGTPKEAGQVIAEKYGITIRRIQQLVNEIVNKTPLKECSPSADAFAAEAEKAAWLENIVKENSGRVTLASLGAQMKEKFGEGSATTVWRLFKRYEYRRAKCRVLPLLTPSHREKRLEWAMDLIKKHEQNKDSPAIFSECTQVTVHVDEKWFYEKHFGRMLWIAPGEEAPHVHCLSKTIPRKVMFLGGLSAPVPSKGFLRSAWLYPIVQEGVTQRKSKNRDGGVSCIKSIEMTKDVFINMMFTKLIPDVLSSTNGFATRIIFQVDNAGGHGGGRGSLENSTFPKLRKLVRSMTPARKTKLWGNLDTFPEIDFVAQPAKSPDLNVLDLGGWRSIEATVTEIDSEGYDWVRTVCDHVKFAWEKWATDSERITRLFAKLPQIAQCIIDCDGGNDYKMPHSKDFKDK